MAASVKGDAVVEARGNGAGEVGGFVPAGMNSTLSLYRLSCDVSTAEVIS